MTSSRLRRWAALVPALLGAGCAGGRPLHVPDPARVPEKARAAPSPAVPDRDARDFREGIVVRVGLHWEKGFFLFGAEDRLVLSGPADSPSRLHPGSPPLRAAAGTDDVVVIVDAQGSPVWQDSGPVRVESWGGHLLAGDRIVRGTLEISVRADSLFVVNAVPLEDYLRGVVPKEIGPRPAEDLEAVAAQAVAARTYTVRRLEQYNSLPFDLFASVQDQVYEGVGGENAVADEAIRKTRDMVLADGHGLIEAFYSSTCGGRRSDIAAVWPHRDVNPALRGGSDGGRGREWCRASPHFDWTETWTGPALSALVREHLPVVAELPPGIVRGDLLDLKVVKRGPSGRVAFLEYRTESGKWTVPGDRNRWILRRPNGSILRSVLVELNVQRQGGRVVRVTAKGSGNGHGVGLCQVGALGRAEAGESWWKILRAYYPGARIRVIRGSDLPPGRAAAL